MTPLFTQLQIEKKKLFHNQSSGCRLYFIFSQARNRNYSLTHIPSGILIQIWHIRMLMINKIIQENHPAYVQSVSKKTLHQYYRHEFAKNGPIFKTNLWPRFWSEVPSGNSNIFKTDLKLHTKYFRKEFCEVENFEVIFSIFYQQACIVLKDRINNFLRNSDSERSPYILSTLEFSKFFLLK